jgi:hypothetical protein
MIENDTDWNDFSQFISKIKFLYNYVLDLFDFFSSHSIFPKRKERRNENSVIQVHY